MSWLYSQALVAEYSVASCSDGARSALSSASPTPRAFLPLDKTTAFSRPSRFGMTFGPLTDALGAELLTWFLAAFRARTSARPDEAQASKATGVGCGRKWLGLLARFDRDTCSLKTPQCSLFEDSDASLRIWPRWGSMLNGECWEREALALLMPEKESGWWPTPTRSPRDASCTMEAALRNLNAMQDSLSFAVARAEFTAGRHMPNGTLNPTWVEWLMGWMLGWTDLKPLETDKCHCAPQAHGGC